MMELKISIIITVFNESKSHLQECLRAVLHQTLRMHEYEIILVDDYSTNPDTLEVIDQLKKSAPSVQVIRLEKNMGQNEARRVGVSSAAGDYIVFVDGDDVITSDAIESLRMQALRTNADVVTSYFFRLNDANQTYEKMTIHGTSFPEDYKSRIEAFFSGSSSFTMCGRLLRRTMLTDEIFDMPRVFHEDMITFGRIMFKAGSISSINRYIYYYRWNPNSTTSKVTEQHIDGLVLAITDWNRQAQLKGLGENLADAIAKKAMVMIDSIVRRVIYSYFDNLNLCLEILAYLWGRLLELQDKLIENSSRQGPKLLREIFQDSSSPNTDDLLATVERLGLAKRPAQFDSSAVLPEGWQQSEMAQRLAGAVVIICQVNYHVRSAARLLPKLREQGHHCIIMDNSAFVAKGARRSSKGDRSGIGKEEYVQIQQAPYGSDWLAIAALVVTFNDFNDDFREALEFRRLLGKRSVSLIEGINDFLRVDFDEPRYLPYRRCDTVFLAGSNDQLYFPDRETYVIGLPLIEALINEKAKFPIEPLAVLNVNFTYGALEERRDDFVAAAAEAFKKAGWRWVITQHPMDKGNLDGMPVSKLTQYELIDRGSVFVSRFATGILEALACGKPAIYFNPHEEKVTKFKEPMGAFPVANTEDELVKALKKVSKDIEDGIDFRKRGLPFLGLHTDYSPNSPSVASKFAYSVKQIIENNTMNNGNTSEVLRPDQNGVNNLLDNCSELMPDGKYMDNSIDYDNSSGLINLQHNNQSTGSKQQYSMKFTDDRLMVLGNGPSLKKEYFSLFQNIPCLGMNAAYRYWERINWYPEYYCCFDKIVVMSHQKKIRDMIEQGYCEHYFLHQNFLRKNYDLVLRQNVTYLCQLTPGEQSQVECAELKIAHKPSRFFSTTNPIKITTGGHSVRVAGYLGYKSIGLIGIDLRYVELIPEAKKNQGITLEITKTPKSNPNYFFSDYQIEGDQYNIPNPKGEQSNLHYEAFEVLKTDIEKFDFNLDITVCTQESQLFESKLFPYSPIDKYIYGSDHHVKTRSKEYLSSTKRVPSLKPLFIYIDCDAIDAWGHYLAYSTHIKKTAEGFGFKVLILGNKKLPTELASKFGDSIKLVFSYFSHLREHKHIKQFSRELEDSLKKLCKENKSLPIFLYMYTGSLEHLEEIVRLSSMYNNIFVTVNLFYNYAIDLHNRSVINRWRQLIESVQNKQSIDITVPTLQIQKDFKNIFGVSFQVAPHPSTTFSDKQVQKMVDCGEHRIQNNTTVLFPGGMQTAKGFEISVKVAEALQKLPDISCTVRAAIRPETGGQQKALAEQLKDSGVNVERGLFDMEGFQQFLTIGDIIVCPYLPSFFARRTSGIVVDSILLGRPFVALKGTWLGDLANSTGAGIAAEATVSDIVSAIFAIIKDYSYFSSKAAQAKRSYIAENSWNRLLLSITNKKGTAIETKNGEFQFIAMLQNTQTNFIQKDPKWASRHQTLLGPFSRKQDVHLDQSSAMAKLLKEDLTDTAIIFVGSPHRTNFQPLKYDGWQKFAFELATNNHTKRLEYITNINGFSAFHEAHRESQKVDAITLTEFFQDKPMPDIDFFKIDTEGHDLSVLQGYPWERCRPALIECKFEDQKTPPTGYSFHDLAKLLVDQGYTVYVSEWHPIIRPCLRHAWKQLLRYPCKLSDQKSWGNLLAFRDTIDEIELKSVVHSSLDFYMPSFLHEERTIIQNGSVFLGKEGYSFEPPAGNNWIACAYRGYIAPGKTVSAQVTFTLNMDCTLNIGLCRSGSTPFENSTKQLSVKKGAHSLNLQHTFKHNHQGARIQIGVVDKPVTISNITSEIIFEYDPAITSSPVKTPQKSIPAVFSATVEDLPKMIQAKPKVVVNTLFIMGNGPSLRGLDFQRFNGYPTLGMNVAFRHWQRINWYPTCYICLDTVVTESQKDGICKLVQEQDKNGIRMFLLRRNLLKSYPKLKDNPSVLFFEDYLHSPAFEDVEPLSTGSHAALFGAMLGYKRICLLGIDCRYVQQIPEAQKVDGHVLEMTSTPGQNPNYFIDDYQQKGDRFNIPDSQPDLHYQSWVTAGARLEKLGVDLVNCNPQSRLDMFDFVDLKDILS